MSDDLLTLAGLPDRQMSDDEFNALRARYEELLGFVPPRIQARTEISARLAPDLLRAQEEWRLQAMYPQCFDVKTAQLILFGILLALTSDAARLHAIGARRAGATWEELNAVVHLAGLFRGLSAANIGSEILLKLVEEQA
jgi:4-carboxymuconolactone decarboxylase